MSRKPSEQAFTLIELMVVVGIMGVLSAIAVPSFAAMMRRSKTAEVSGNLNAMFKNAASYYVSERAGQGNIASIAGHCTVEDAGPSPTVPGRTKQPFAADASFRALGFDVADFVYYSYGLAAMSGLSSCDNTASVSMYTFYAHGDLDGDSTESTFELASGTDESNVLYHSRGIYIAHELE
jgi:prepilin-type N-terminal cleavage/methylation domain-containing protein